MKTALGSDPGGRSRSAGSMLRVEAHT